MTVSECYGGLEPVRGYVDAGAARLGYLRWGTQGPPAVLLHGITSSARTWWRVAPQLAARGYQVFAFDLPGHGESDISEDHTIVALAALVARGCEQLAITEPLLIGHSWGGATALMLAGQLATTRLVLVDPLIALARAGAETRIEPFLVGLGLPRDSTPAQLRAKNPDWHACDVYWKAEALEQCRELAVRGLFMASGDWDLAERLGLLRSPTLLLVADPQHTIVSPAQQSLARQALLACGGALVAVPGTNHNMFRGAGYGPFIEVLLGWLA